MVRPFSYQTKESRHYQQALDNFGITELLAKLSHYSDQDFDSSWMRLEEQEIESLAAVLILELANSINGKLIARYLDAMGKGNRDIPPVKLRPPSIDLPANFLDSAKTPRFLYGDKVRWLNYESEPDWGIVIGRFYSFAPHLCHWTWCYLIWLSKHSPSAASISADIAWEQDLEPLSEEVHL